MNCKIKYALATKTKTSSFFQASTGSYVKVDENGINFILPVNCQTKYNTVE